MTVLIRDIPETVLGHRAVPFKLFVPRDLLGNMEAASAGYVALTQHDHIVAADPFVAAGVSSVFPGIIYVDENEFPDADRAGLRQVVELLEAVTVEWPEDYEDAWVELWLPDALEPAAEALDVTDLTEG